MKILKNTGLDFVVDKLTNSIENVITRNSFPTDVTIVTKDDLKTVNKKSNWQFDWKFELKQPERDVCKLNIVNNHSIIRGLMSLKIKTNHIYIHLIESAPFNKGKTKVYAGVLMYLFFQRLSLFSITVTLWEQSTLEVAQ